jgi:hypothetical protein
VPPGGFTLAKRCSLRNSHRWRHWDLRRTKQRERLRNRLSNYTSTGIAGLYVA